MKKLALITVALTLVAGCQTQTKPADAPVAATVPAVVPVPATVAPAPKPTNVKAEQGPLARTVNITDNYHGTVVADPYRYMEDWQSAEVQQWAKSHAAFTRTQLDKLPGRTELLQRLTALSKGSVNVVNLQIRGSRHFYLKREPGDRTFKLMTRDRFDGAERTLIDVSSASGDPANITFYSASPDGRYLAYGVSTGGREVSVVSVYDVLANQSTSDTLMDVVMAEGFKWHPDSRGFYYLRSPNPAEVFLNARATYHVIGRSQESDVSFFGTTSNNATGQSLAAVDIPLARPSQTANVMLMGVMHGDDKYLSIYSAPLAGLTDQASWRRIASPSDQVTAFDIVGTDVYLLSTKDAPRGKLLQTNATRGTASAATTIAAQGDYVIRSFAIAQDGVYLREMAGGLDLLQYLPINRGVISGKREFIRLPFDLTISEMIADVKRRGVTLRLQGWTEPPQYVAVGTKALEIAKLDLIPRPEADFADVDELRIEATAQDGTKIPVSLLYKRGTRLDGFNPLLMNAYGAYGISQTPSFQAERLAWIERGGVLATCHVRGGGEYGEVWHRGGQKENKEKGASDLIACAEAVIQRRFTQPARLAITGGSAGGITVGGALARRPELFAAVVARVGALDMLRMELTANGKPNIAEFGTVTKSNEFKWLYATSPYHMVKDGTAYPGTLVTTGANDPRVEPWMSAKFAARLLAANGGTRPTLLRINYQTGHGSGATRDAQLQELADVYSFALWQMGEPAFQPPGTAGVTPGVVSNREKFDRTY
jgi:prolyl oligopeptidase